MSWRRLIQQLMNQEQVIRSLEDSAPIRKAAKYTVYLLQRGKQRAQESMEQIKNHPTLKDAEDTAYEEARKRGQNDRYQSFKNTFAQELEKGLRDIKSKTKGGK